MSCPLRAAYPPPSVRLVGKMPQVFNSRSTQLVLGAGAIHSAANLKSISAKHLALCSQSLGLVRSLIPYLKAALATRLPQKHHLLLTQMDTVAQVPRRKGETYEYLNHYNFLEDVSTTRSKIYL